MLVLASSSARRLELLRRIGYAPDDVCAADVDESPLHKEKPPALVRRLALTKARVVASKFPTATIIAADTVAYCKGKYLCKPQDAEEAASHLRWLSGRRHRVYTGLCVIHGDREIVKICVSILKFKRLTEHEIAVHTDSKEWEGKSGGYSLHGRAAMFVEWMQGTDSNVMGLPLHEAYCLLQGVAGGG